MSRLFVGSRGIFFENLTIFSPKTALRSSRSNEWRSLGAVGDSSRRTNASFVESAENAHPPYRRPGVWCLKFFWILPLGYCCFPLGVSLVFGAWCLDLFIRCLELGVWSLVFGVWCLVFNTWLSPRGG